MKKSEDRVRQEVRLYVQTLGAILMRNNSGVLPDPKTNRWVSFGLGNESKEQNKVFKSPDDIGILPVVITQEMVGKTIGVFFGVEGKEEGWQYRGTEHEQGQRAFNSFINEKGGLCCFAQSVDDVKKAIGAWYRRLIS